MNFWPQCSKMTYLKTLVSFQPAHHLSQLYTLTRSYSSCTHSGLWTHLPDFSSKCLGTRPDYACRCGNAFTRSKNTTTIRHSVICKVISGCLSWQMWRTWSHLFLWNRMLACHLRYTRVRADHKNAQGQPWEQVSTHRLASPCRRIASSGSRR